MIKIDKSVFTAEELEQYEALIAKATVDPEAAEEEYEEEIPETPPKKKKTEKAEVEDMEETKKSDTPAEIPDFVKDAIAKSEEFITRIEKKEMTEIAKKYSVLGEKPEELGEKLYNLKKSDEKMYETCIAMMDSQVALIEKSGLFAEVGKSAGGYTSGGNVESKIQAKASEIMKRDGSDYNTAVCKAWEENPDLMAEYDEEYYR